jgi:hypothetical protein
MMGRQQLIDETIDAVTTASRIPRGEFASRANAYKDVMAAFGKVLTTLKAIRAQGKVSSDDIAAIAGKIMAGLYKPTSNKTVPAGQYNSLLADAIKVSGSVVSQADGPEPDDPNQLPLNIEGSAERSLRDAQEHGQAAPIVKTVVVGDGSTGLKKDAGNNVT